jgi:ABC-type glycerol-3-phosphate transport system substrate-binding protein
VANLVAGDSVNSPARAYNSAKPDSPYRVEVKDYGNAYSLYDDRITNLHQDILSGNAPDVITFNSEITPGSFGARESIFVDLYTLLDKDTELKREDFLDGYLEGLDFNGKLLQISPCFTFKTMVVKDKFLDGLTSWNYDQFAEKIKALPEGMRINPMENNKLEYNFLQLMDYSEFVDYENALCDFENEGFIKALNIVRNNHIGLNSAEFDSWMNESGGFDVYNQGQYINDESMIYEMDLGGWFSLRQTLHARFNEPTTLVGYPSENGNGSFVQPSECMGIMANSPCIEGAWDFIKTVYFSEEYYSNNNGVYGGYLYPAVEEYYVKQLEEQKNATYTDENGETIRGDMLWIGPEPDDTITYYEFTDEECEKYDKIVREAAKDVRQGDNVIYNIIREETMPFFEGEYTAEKTAEIIQNRVSIYLSEKYG